jgi:hypothetical protein
MTFLRVIEPNFDLSTVYFNPTGALLWIGGLLLVTMFCGFSWAILGDSARGSRVGNNLLGFAALGGILSMIGVTIFNLIIVNPSEGRAVLVSELKEWAVQEELVVLTNDQADEVLENQVDVSVPVEQGLFVDAVDAYGDNVLVLLTHGESSGYDLVVVSLDDLEGSGVK